jgi:hypothetical protein
MTTTVTVDAPGFDGVQAFFDAPQQLRLFDGGGDSEPHEAVCQPKIGKDTLWVVVEVQHLASTEEEVTCTSLAKRRVATQLAQQRRDALERTRAGTLHGRRPRLQLDDISTK